MRSFLDDGVACNFCPEKLQNLYIEAKSFDKAKKYVKIDEDLHQIVGVEADTVKKWRLGKFGPDTLDEVKKIAEYFKIDYQELLTPIVTKEFNFNAPSDDEKQIIIYIHKLLTDFLYTYLSASDMYSFHISYSMRRRNNETESVNEAIDRIHVEVEDYFINLYKLLDTESLKIRQSTYDKLHRLITECHALYDYACTESHTSDWPFYNKRWGMANPRLEKLLDYYENYYGTEEDNEYKDFENDYTSETGISDYILANDLGGEYMPMAYDAVPREFARTLALLFREDFKELFEDK